MKKFFADFKKFISRGNIIDMAVGVIVGNAFSAIVKAFTDKVIMPLINLLLSLGGENGLESAFTFLKKGYTDGVLDLTKSIYIDWGAFITAIINFLIIALTLFVIIRVAMKSNELMAKARENIKKGQATKEEKAALKERGVDPKDKKAYKAALLAYRKELEEKAAEEKANEKPVETETDVLKEIRDLLKAQQESTKK
ncbi:MAG: large conductance mechanosensitive channel protein MscL [Clostridia bacterium]|nr:large conductance mechanosensitive channel protein MscL [Clostridia bacterium]